MPNICRTMVILSAAHQQKCLFHPVVPAVMFGGLFTGLNVYQGARLSPQLVGLNVGSIYVYGALQCPMEALHERQSCLHNALSGAILGYEGVRRGMVGVPFVDAYFFMRYPKLQPALVGAAVYGLICGVLGAMGGKPL